MISFDYWDFFKFILNDIMHDVSCIMTEYRFNYAIYL